MRLAAFALLVTVLAGAKDKKAPAASTEELAAIAARGRMLYDCDQAAWHASDALQTTNPPKEKMGRYIAYKTGDVWVVSFGHLNEQKDGFLEYYQVAPKADIQKYIVKSLEPAKVDTGFLLFAARAIDTSLSDFRGEWRPYNTAVLPADEGRIYVYVFPAQTRDDIVPLGGDVRYLISPDGLQIIDKRQMHKTILEISRKGPGETVAQAHNHVLSDVPEDTDVFHALSNHLPEFVGAGGHVYGVELDGRIRVIN